MTPTLIRAAEPATNHRATVTKYTAAVAVLGIVTALSLWLGYDLWLILIEVFLVATLIACVVAITALLPSALGGDEK